MTSVASEARSSGRPRDQDADRRILDAALALLGRDGFARMSVDAVSAAAGVPKSTIYRRYPGKAELASAALADLAARRDAPAPPVIGDLRTDLVVQLRHFLEGVNRPFGVALVGTVLTEERETPELLEMYQRVIVEPRRAMVRAVLADARKRGDVRADLDLDLAVSALIGAFYATYLASGPVDDGWAERAVSVLISGFRPGQPSSGANFG